MTKKQGRSARSPSPQTRRNWWVDALLFLSAVVVVISSFYFLYAPTGYQGGRNPDYNPGWILDRLTWDWLHTWFGIGMILAATVHFVLHWKWFVMMGRRVWRRLIDGNIRMTRMAWVNLMVNLTIAAGFFLAAISGVYFLFATGGQGVAKEIFIFSSLTWDVIHTWSGIVMFLAFLGHTMIHWRWIEKVSRRMIFRVLNYKPTFTPGRNESSLEVRVKTSAQNERGLS